jgi:cell surface protein SprA
MDLGEGSTVYNDNVQSRIPGPAFNGANDLSQVLNLGAPSRLSDQISNYLENIIYGPGAMVNGTDFERITSARKLSPTEFTFHRQLGYITLARKLQNDEALAVAFEYTYNGRTYKVGELTEDYNSRPDNEVIFLKLLRPRKIAIRDSRQRIIPTWDLMMKNIYTLNVTQLSREGFQLRIVYRDDRTGIDNPQLQEGINVRNRQLIEVFGLDRLNPVNDLQRDGNFDFVEGLTINTQYGMIIFPFVEPFNTALRQAFVGEPQEEFLINKYVYETL